MYYSKLFNKYMPSAVRIQRHPSGRNEVKQTKEDKRFFTLEWKELKRYELTGEIYSDPAGHRLIEANRNSRREYGRMKALQEKESNRQKDGYRVI